MQKLSTKPHPAVLKKTQNTCKKSKIVVEVVHTECGVRTSSVCQHTELCGMWLGKSFGEVQVCKSCTYKERQVGCWSAVAGSTTQLKE